MIRTFAVLAVAAALAACGDSLGPVRVVGDYTLARVNGQPVPAEMIPAFYLTSATIALRADGTYSARTCYASDMTSCTASRGEFGTYTVDRHNVVALRSGDGYARELTATPGALTQRGGGDFQCNDPEDRLAGKVCFVLVYTK